MNKLRFIDLSQCSQKKSKYFENDALVIKYAPLQAAATHLVYSENGKYLATETSENKIHIWRAQYNGKFEEYAQLSDHMTSTISAIRFSTISVAATGYESRVLLLVLYNDGKDHHLHTYDILTRQETRVPVTVAHLQDTSISNLLVDVSGSMECVVSATLRASTLNVVTPLRSISAAVQQRFYNLLKAPTHSDAVKLFREHPAVAFQPIMKPGFPSYSLVEHVIWRSEQLLCLLDPDLAVLDGKQSSAFKLLMLRATCLTACGHLVSILRYNSSTL
jgi:hypothetical protein